MKKGKKDKNKCVLKLLLARIKKAEKVHFRLMDANGTGVVGPLYFIFRKLAVCRMSASNDFQPSNMPPIFTPMNSTLLESSDVSKGYGSWASVLAIWERNAGVATMGEVQPNASSSVPVVSKTLAVCIQWGLCLEMSLDLCNPAKQFSDSTKTNPRTILSLFIFISKNITGVWEIPPEGLKLPATVRSGEVECKRNPVRYLQNSNRIKKSQISFGLLWLRRRVMRTLFLFKIDSLTDT